MKLSRDRACKALGTIRLANCAVALFAPRLMARVLGEKEPKSAVIYALRMFGVRTVIIGLQLFVAEGEELDKAVRVGVIIHASDVVAAAAAGIHGDLAPRPATTATIISTVNTGLAVIAATH